jgi:hypothetical protein
LRRHAVVAESVNLIKGLLKTCRDSAAVRYVQTKARRDAHILETIAKSDACAVAANVAVPSWPGLSGPPVAAQVLELMARTSRAMTV